MESAPTTRTFLGAVPMCRQAASIALIDHTVSGGAVMGIDSAAMVTVSAKQCRVGDSTENDGSAMERFGAAMV